MEDLAVVLVEDLLILMVEVLEEVLVVVIWLLCQALIATHTTWTL
tara:strand:+ start:152 stop:286 length:135 start_codon:yes stop_codon:yes gene_type:complete